MSMPGIADGTAYFSVPVFFVIMREVVEIGLVVVITLSYLNDNKLAEFKKYAVAGCATGTLLDVIIASLILGILYTVQSNAFEGRNGRVFNSTLRLFAGIVMTFFGISMHKMFSDLNAKMDKKFKTIAQLVNNVVVRSAEVAVDDDEERGGSSTHGGSAGNADASSRRDDWETGSHDALVACTRGTVAVPGKDVAATEPNTDESIFVDNPAAKSKIAWGVFSVTFFAVFREGLECIVFLGGLSGTYPPTSIPAAAIVGLIVGSLISYTFFLGGRSGCVSMQVFVNASVMFLFLMAAGMIERAFGDFVKLGMAAGPMLWDTRKCCSSKQPFWGFMTLLFGYNDHPTFVEFCVYFLYWGVVYAAGQYHGIWTSFLCCSPCKKTPGTGDDDDDDDADGGGQEGAVDEAVEEEGLPKFWASAQDSRTGITYYYSRVDGTVTWDRPSRDHEHDHRSDPLPSAHEPQLHLQQPAPGPNFEGPGQIAVSRDIHVKV